MRRRYRGSGRVGLCESAYRVAVRIETWFVVAALITSCGDKRPEPPATTPSGSAPTTPTAPALVLSATQIEAPKALATRLDQVGKQLATQPLDAARDAVIALRATPAWRRAAASTPRTRTDDFAAKSDAVRERLSALATTFVETSKRLRALHDQLAAPGGHTLADMRATASTEVAAAIAPLGVAVLDAAVASISPLDSDLIDEIVLAREICNGRSPPREPCARTDALHAASDWLVKMRALTRRELNEGSTALATGLGDLLDERAKAAIDKAAMRGPSYGEPCGLEGLCEHGLMCSPKQTCETACREAAMQPCPGGTHCETVEGVGKVCRR